LDRFDTLESGVRSYCRSFPVVFDRAQGALLYDDTGRRYIDFLSGAGSINYGHNNPRLKAAVVDYLQRDGITHSLDLATVAKRRFMDRFEQTVLAPRRLRYTLQFTGPTGANGVEAALKLARKVKRRRNIVAFSGAYHGLSAGALAVTSNRSYRDESFVTRADVSFLPYEGALGAFDTSSYLRQALDNPASGVDLPAAVILECVQGEGGVNVASTAWLRAVASACREHDVLLIVDDVQAGCGRTGDFFSFERAGIEPDVVVLSKSISGLGLPMTVVLLKPELDVWEPGEHSGTFRGNNLAFVAGAEALAYWDDPAFPHEIRRRGAVVARTFDRLARACPGAAARGIGLIRGLDVGDPALAVRARREAFARGLIVELCGARQTTIKALPPLVIDDAVLEEGLGMLEAAVNAALAVSPAAAEA